MRKAFNFYSNFDDVASDLNDKQFTLFMRALLDVQFLRKHIDDVSFDDKIVSITWKAIKHSIAKQIQGHCNKNKIDYNALFHDVYPPSLAGLNHAQLQEKEKEKEEEEVEEAKQFSFTLSKTKLLSSTSEEYQRKLEDYILNTGRSLKYQDFYDQCEMKPYKYKNYKMAYDKWTRDERVVKVHTGGIQC